MNTEEESTGQKIKRNLSFKIGKPRNPFKKNPYKKKDDSGD